MIKPPKKLTSGMRRARLVDVAKAAAVSVSVAGKILNGGKGNSRSSRDTVARVEAAAESLGYLPHPGARHMRGKRTFTYGILVASAGDPLSSFLVQHLDSESVTKGRRTIISNTLSSEKKGGDRFEDQAIYLLNCGVDGVFCLVHNWWPGDRRKLLELHPNTVFFEDPGIPGAVVVKPSYEESILLSVSHLRDRGRKRIGMVVENGMIPTGKERVKGFRRAYKNMKEPFDDGLVFDGKQKSWVCGRYDPDSLSWLFPEELAEQAVEKLVAKERCDAIVAHNDYWASVLLRCLKRRGIRVPEEVAVIGYMNHYLADWVDPPLTSISPSHLEAARAMACLLEKMVEGEVIPEEDRYTCISPRLVVRQSTS